VCADRIAIALAPEDEVLRVGGAEPRKVDIRIVAATNRPIREEIAAGRFREDLFFRLNIIPIQLAPLRERREDILPLAWHFLARQTEETERPLALSAEAENALMSHRWSGNVPNWKIRSNAAVCWRAVRP
jgi:transcriptional regulator with PAS, ATPase and Fis domain